MNDIILCIKEEYAKLILTGKKKIELRKALPATMPDRVWLYATAPAMKIVGFFVPERMVAESYLTAFCDGEKGLIWERAAVAKKEFQAYYKDCRMVRYYEIKEAHRCDLPFPGEKVPRNFIYFRNSPCDSCWAMSDSEQHCISMHECNWKKYKEEV